MIPVVLALALTLLLATLPVRDPQPETTTHEIAVRLRLLKVVADQEAVAPAQRVYDEAVAPAQRVYDEAVATAHARECPDCPWDGRTIFPGAGKP